MKTHLVFGLITALLLVIVISSRRQENVSVENVASLGDVMKEAGTMAREGWLHTTPALPRALQDISAAQYQSIKWRDEKTLWRAEGLPFQVRFYPTGYIYDRPVAMSTITDGTSKEFPYSNKNFDFSKAGFDFDPPSWAGYAGFRLYYPFVKADTLDELLSFLGGSNFRAVAKDLVSGLSSRALVIDPTQGRSSDETPVFTGFWLRRPDSFATQFTIYALLESRSVTGAYQFDVESAGTETKIHVWAKLYFREKLYQIGYAPLVSMYWFGENTSNTFGDFRPEVHKSDGLLLQKDSGEWLWHPLSWSDQAQVNIFDGGHPKGFGLFQRDRDFSHYQDLTALFHKMPSVWVEPIHGFDDGNVYLTQRPTTSDQPDNVMAFWSPKTTPSPLVPVEIEYVLHWFADSAAYPPLGRCISTRVDLQDQANRRQFFLDFSGGPLDRLKQGDTPVADIPPPDGATISGVKVEKNDFNHSWRVSFFVDTDQKAKPPTDILCRLMLNGAPASETWNYTWMR